MALKSDKKQVYTGILLSNAPWIFGSKMKVPEAFRREAFFAVKKEMEAKHGMAVLIKGPRRVGKTEILKQLIWELVQERKLSPLKALYLSFDDVQIQSEAPEKRAKMVLEILDAWANMLGYDSFDLIQEEAYCFFDEVQVVKDWDYLVKNRVERNPFVKITLSGSAAHTIFQKSLKTLMGRVIPVEISTFSFREFLEKVGILTKKERELLQGIQQRFEITLSPKGLYTDLKSVFGEYDGFHFQRHISRFVNESGFPQIWKIGMEPDSVLERARFIDENYIKKVTLEDLMLLQQIKKPEIYERLMRHLFARPAQEYNQVRVAQELGITQVTLGEAIKLLQQTDLFIFVEKFSNKAEPLRRKNLKIYPIDYGLTFAMTKITPDIEADVQKGTISESLVAQTLRRLKGVNQIAFLQKHVGGIRKEVDFYLRSDLKDCPVEVKYRNQLNLRDFDFMLQIIAEKRLEGGIVVNIDTWEAQQQLYFMPLWAFMLIA